MLSALLPPNAFNDRWGFLVGLVVEPWKSLVDLHPDMPQPSTGEARETPLIAQTDWLIRIYSEQTFCLFVGKKPCTSHLPPPINPINPTPNARFSALVTQPIVTNGVPGLTKESWELSNRGSPRCTSTINPHEVSRQFLRPPKKVWHFFSWRCWWASFLEFRFFFPFPGWKMYKAHRVTPHFHPATSAVGIYFEHCAAMCSRFSSSKLTNA